MACFHRFMGMSCSRLTSANEGFVSKLGTMSNHPAQMTLSTHGVPTVADAGQPADQELRMITLQSLRSCPKYNTH